MCENDVWMGPTIENSSSGPLEPSEPEYRGAFPGNTRELFPVVYQQLRDLAHRKMAREPDGLTLQTTALVHEVYLRLSKDPSITWENPRQFFAVAAEAMRRILVERARRYATHKRGGGKDRVDLDSIDAAVETADPAAMLALDEALVAPPNDADGLLALDEALSQLAAEDPEAASLVHLRYFAGLSVEEVAQALGISRAHAYRQWTFARAWLLQALSGGEPA